MHGYRWIVARSLLAACKGGGSVAGSGYVKDPRVASLGLRHLEAAVRGWTR